MYSDNFDYALVRLKGTLVIKKGTREPVYIGDLLNAGGNIICCVYENTDVMHLGLDEIDLTPVPLGYANTNGGATYIMRKPVREGWKQGLSTKNITFMGPSLPIPSEPLIKTVKGIYPSLQECLERTTKKSHSYAFSRSFAIDRCALYYKSHEVGKNNDGNLVLNGEFDYLEEALKESM